MNPDMAERLFFDLLFEKAINIFSAGKAFISTEEFSGESAEKLAHILASRNYHIINPEASENGFELQLFAPFIAPSLS